MRIKFFIETVWSFNGVTSHAAWSTHHVWQFHHHLPRPNPLTFSWWTLHIFFYIQITFKPSTVFCSLNPGLMYQLAIQWFRRVFLAKSNYLMVSCSLKPSKKIIQQIILEKSFKKSPRNLKPGNRHRSPKQTPRVSPPSLLNLHLKILELHWKLLRTVISVLLLDPN